MVLPIYNSVEILTYNLRHAWAEDGKHAWPQRKTVVRRLLTKINPDIVCFQEVNSFVIPFLEEALPEHVYVGDREEQGEYWEYRPVFVRRGYKIRNWETITLSRTPEVPSASWGSSFVRQATRVLIEIGSRQVAVYNVHLDFKAWTRLNQASVIWNAVRERDRDRPVILAGDFNGPPASRAYRLLTGFRAGPGCGLPSGDFLDAMPRPQPPTMHGFTGTGRLGYIDWILYRGDIRPLAPARVIHYHEDGIYPSDHFPVLARLGL